MFRPVHLSYNDKIIDNAVERYTERQRRGPRDGITFPELLAEFGFIFESVTADPTVASAFAQMRLSCKKGDVLEAADFVIGVINKALANPFDVKFWQIKDMNDVYQSKIGRHPGGPNLMRAVGFHVIRHPAAERLFTSSKSWAVPTEP